MKAKHTQGENRLVRYIGYIPETGETKYACKKNWGTGVPIPNTYLIEAAPELLEACKKALTAIDERIINASKGQSLKSAEQVLMTIIAQAEK